MIKMPLLTKSKYIIGLQCPQLLWVTFNAKEQLPEVDAATQANFDTGNLVGNLAKKWYSNGIDISSDDFMGNINQTKELLKNKVPLFEAGFMKDNLFSRVDILNPTGNEWDIIEVKSSTKTKPEHIQDVSFQKLCCEKAGLKIRKCFLMHINNEYIKEGEIDHKLLFVQDDITEEVNEVEGIQERIDHMFEIIKQDKMPDPLIGEECDKPYKCPLKHECWKFLPENNVFELYRGGKKSWDLFVDGIHKIEEIPDEFKLTDKQELQRDCEKQNKIHINKEAIKHFLNTLHYPLYHFDFETVSFAVPRYDGTKPYQQIPFQYSLHIEQEDGSVEHHEFLAEGNEDPRPKLLEQLKGDLEGNGSIVVFNQSFEISRLKEMAEAFPEHKDWIENALTRIVDLLIPFRNFSYYNPKQKGSASIKKVMPAIAGKGYSELEINNGGDASLSFVNIMLGKTTGEEAEKVRKNLLIYCGLDTEGMIWIVNELKKLVE